MLNQARTESKEKRNHHLCIELPKKQGENARRLLLEIGFLDKNLTPHVLDDKIFLPIVRRPSAGERRELKKTLGDFRITLSQFRSRPEKIGSLSEILEEGLPRNVTPLVSKSFDIIGDIGILELSPEAARFERKIADALTKVNKSVKVVYSKAGPVADEYRLRPLHHVLGPKRTKTSHKENGCILRVDVSKAFFSPRLSNEHNIVARQVNPDEVVVDMFAGVGPFSIQIAKKNPKTRIHAIDANPNATILIRENMRLNKVEHCVQVWTGDSRIIIKNELNGIATRILMNHPSQAKTFLDSACDALKPEGGTIHYYTFANSPNSELAAKRELATCLAKLGRKIEKTLAVRNVRGVGPGKWQVAVDARVTPIRGKP